MLELIFHQETKFKPRHTQLMVHSIERYKPAGTAAQPDGERRQLLRGASCAAFVSSFFYRGAQASSAVQTLVCSCSGVHGAAVPHSSSPRAAEHTECSSTTFLRMAAASERSNLPPENHTSK